MTRINLLPPEKIKKKRAPGERSYVWLIIVLPLIILLAMGFWWFSLSSQLSQKEEALEAAKKELADIQAKNQQLAQYKTRQEEIARIETVAVNALKGRVYWARILNNIAIMCPSDIWLTALTCSTSEQTVSFQGIALQCPNREYCGYGIYPYYPDYRPIAGWLDRMAQIEEFDHIWLTSAAPMFQGAICNEAAETTTELVTGNRWYEDPYCVGTCIGSATSTANYTCFLGDWVIEFVSQAGLDMNSAVVVSEEEAETTTPSNGEPESTTPSNGEPESTTPPNGEPESTTPPEGESGGGEGR